MRVGVVILPQFSWPEARARWASLQERGFAHGWTYDHLSWRDLKDEPWFGTLPTLVAAATATTTLRVGTWVMSPNYRHPVTTAKDLMTLDDVDGFGEVLVGTAAVGGRPVHDDLSAHDADPGTAARLDPRFREEVHVCEAGDTRPKHLRGGEQRSIRDELLIDPAPFRGPDPLVEPRHQRYVVGESSQQRHRRVGVRVHQAGQ